MPIRVLVYEDNTPLREALSVLIDGTSDYDLVGAFGDNLRVVSQVAGLQPDVILMDIDMPGQTGIEAIRKLRQQPTVADVLILTVFDDDDRVFEAIRAGATGYLLKKTQPSRLLEAIREVYEGGAPMSPSIARKVMQTLHYRPNTDISQLTTREGQVLARLADGMSYKLVAADMEISIETVRTYIKRIYEKLHVHSVTEALAKFRS